MDRISELTVLEQGFEPPQDFDIQAYLAQEDASQPAMTVRMRFSPQMASVARDNSLSWEKLEEQPDGSVIVTFLAPDVIWATSSGTGLRSRRDRVGAGGSPPVRAGLGPGHSRAIFLIERRLIWKSLIYGRT